MTAVLLACGSALLFGAMTVAMRFALQRSPDPRYGAVVTVATAFAVSLVALAFELPNGSRLHGLDVFALAGALAPGTTQVLFTFAVRDAGPARASAVTATAPLAAVAIALVFLGEPLKVPLLLGALLVVAGGVMLVAERDRPDHFRLVGMGFGLAAAFLIAGRDNLVRWAAHGTRVAPLVGNATALAVGLTLAVAYWLATRQGRRPPFPWPFVAVGVLFGLSYLCLYEAYYHGKVTVVSPIVATEALWAVGLSALLIQRTELVGRRLAVGALLVVAGGALIGAFR